jgi:hypothetical protein
MIPISVTSQGDEIARGQSSADPLGRDLLRSPPYCRSPDLLSESGPQD